MKIVLDTNCLVRILPKQSPYRCLWDAFLDGYFELCYSTEILFEYEEILSQFYFPKIAEFAVGTMVKAKKSNQITPHFKWKLIFADPDDNKFIDCAVSAGADYIVTNDKHFNILKSIPFPQIKVIDLDVFRDMIMY